MSSLRNFMTAYNAVHNPESREEFYSKRDELSEMDFSLITQDELSDIAEEALQELFDEGYTPDEAELVFLEVIEEAKVTYGHDTESPRAKKVSAMKKALKGALGKVREKASRGAVKTYGAYRSGKQAIQDKARKTSQNVKNMSAQTSRKASEAKSNIKKGLKGLVKKAADRVASGASKLSQKMSEAKMDDTYLEPDMKKRQKNNEKARKDLMKGPQMKNPHFEEVSTLRKDWSDAYLSIYEKKMDPVGQEDSDIDNDGDTDSTDKYLHNRRKAIGKAMGKKGKCEKCGMKDCECDHKDKKDMKEGAGMHRDAKTGEVVNKAEVGKTYYPNMPRQKSSVALRKEKEAAKDKKPSGYRPNLADVYGANRRNTKPLKMKKEEVQFSEAELEAIQAKVDSWDIEESQYARNNPEKYEREVRKTETSGQKAERRVRDRLKTMDPKRAEAMKKQMRSVGLDV